MVSFFKSNITFGAIFSGSLEWFSFFRIMRYNLIDLILHNVLLAFLANSFPFQFLNFVGRNVIPLFRIDFISLSSFTPSRDRRWFLLGSTGHQRFSKLDPFWNGSLFRFRSSIKANAWITAIAAIEWIRCPEGICRDFYGTHFCSVKIRIEPLVSLSKASFSPISEIFFKIVVVALITNTLRSCDYEFGFWRWRCWFHHRLI